MTEYDVKRLALVLAIQAEIEGMKAANDRQRNYHLADPLYLQHDFDSKAEELRNLAAKHNEQLYARSGLINHSLK